MEGAFTWLGQLMDTIGKVFPRLTIVAATHEGVAFIRGKNVKLIKPGLIIWWPVWTEIMLYPAVRQSLNLPNQTLTSQDGHSVTVGAVVVYRVDDMVTALSEQWDLGETVSDLSMAAVCEFICTHEFDWINGNRAVVRRRLTKAVTEALEPYGVAVEGAWLTDLARTRVLSVVGNSMAIPYEEEEE